MSDQTARQLRHTWHRAAAARALISGLDKMDVRLAVSRAGPGPGHLQWHPNSAHGAATFDALDALRKRAVGTSFTRACDARARAAALGLAQRAPSTAAVVAARFGDPDRWLGFSADEATRRFRANGPR
jgi:hypothetical protein